MCGIAGFTAIGLPGIDRRDTIVKMTEVLLQLLVFRGHRALQQLNGMFAFAFWDAATCRLLLARDRMGQKPLYYTATGKDVVFASELKSLRHEIRELAQELFSADNLRRDGMFDPVYANWFLQQHLEGKGDYRKELWNLLCFLLWRDKHL